MRSLKEPFSVSQDEPTPLEKVRKHLETYPLYEASQEIFIKEDDKNIFINWQTARFVDDNWHINRGSHFDVQITGKTMYILHIEVAPEFRGRGFGFLLYLLLEEIAKEFGCHIMEMTPSGWTTTPEKETRMNYVVRKLHYVPKGITAIKDICPDGLSPDGAVCPRCGKRRGPSGIDGGTWVHY